jgi:FSR family fosmidomycin resistance protein-like MFS transporter
LAAGADLFGSSRREGSNMQKKYLYFMSAAHLCNDISCGALPAILPFFVLNYGMDYTSMAGLIFASSFLSSIIQPIFGLLADKTSKAWFMGTGVFLSGTALSVTGFITDYWLIFAAVTVMGIGSAVFHPEAARLVNAVSGNKRGAGMSIFSVGGNGGFGLGPIIAVALLTGFGMKGTAFFGIVGVLMGAALFIIVPHIKAKASAIAVQNERGAVAAGQRAAAVNDWPAFVRLAAVIMTRSAVFSGISGFLPLFCIQALGTSKAIGSGTLSIISLAGIVMTLVGGWLADRWGYVKVLRYCSVLLVPLLALVAIGQNIWLVYAALLPMSLAMQAPYSSTVVLGQSYLAKNIGFASGVTLGLGFSIGGIVAPALGRFADTYGIISIMMLITIIALASALATFFLPQPGSRKMEREHA